MIGLFFPFLSYCIEKGGIYMNHTRKIIFFAYFIGFILSTSLLSTAVPILNYFVIPFIFHFVKKTKLKENMAFITLYIILQLLIASSSFISLVFTLYESMVLLFCVLLINLFKHYVKTITLFLFTYYFVTINLLTLIIILLIFEYILPTLSLLQIIQVESQLQAFLWFLVLSHTILLFFVSRMISLFSLKIENRLEVIMQEIH
jgi:hypothetical protein